MKPLVLAVLIILVLGSIAYADPLVTATYTQITGGYRLNFAVTAGQYSIFRFGIDRTDAFDVSAPEGWGGAVGFRETQWWASANSYDIQSGQTLIGFACTIPEQPQQIEYYVSQMNTTPAVYRSTLTPTAAPVPEPSSILALFGGLASIGGFALRRRK